MGFFQEYDVIQYQKTKIRDFDKECARRLYFVVAKSRRLIRRPNLSRWAFFFHELYIKLDFDRDRILKVLDWFETHVSDKWTPLVYSADMFVAKFYQIESAMKRDSIPETLSKDVLSKTEIKLVEKLSEWNWPKDFNRHLPQVVQESFHNVKILSQRISTLRPKSLRRYIFDYWYCEPVFLEQWFESAIRRVQDWDDWSGNPSSIIFRVSSPQFRNSFCSWVNEYTSDPDLKNRAVEFVLR